MGESSRKFSSAFNQMVRRHRLAQELSQEALSERADVDRTYVGLLERGHRGVGLDVAKRLAEALGLSLTELVAEAEEEWQGQLPERHRKALQPMVAEPKEPWPTAQRPAQRKRRRSQPLRSR